MMPPQFEQYTTPHTHTDDSYGAPGIDRRPPPPLLLPPPPLCMFPVDDEPRAASCQGGVPE